MTRIVLIVFMALLIGGCSARPFVPAEYPLSDDVVPAMKINGSAVAVNDQLSTEQVVVYSYTTTTLASDLHIITDAMVQQTNHELTKHGSVVGPGIPKTIDIRVRALRSRYVAFFWKSELSFSAKLGNGAVIEKTVNHSSGFVLQDLNGCIADSVAELLTDPAVQTYLTQ